MVIGHGDEALVFENLKPNDAIRIDGAVEREFGKGNLSLSSNEIRFEYLLHHPEDIEKTVNLNENEWMFVLFVVTLLMEKHSVKHVVNYQNIYQ